MSEQAQPSSEPYRVPAILNPRRTVWAVNCPICGHPTRCGPGSKAGILRMIRAVGAECNDCRDAFLAAPAPRTDQREATGPRETEED